jgi:TonB family protein
MIATIFFRFCFKRAFVVLLLLPLSGIAQKIIIDEEDSVLKQKKIELSPLKLVATSATKMNLSLGAAGSTVYLRLSGSGTGANIVNIGDKVIFRLDNDSTVTVQSSSLQTYDVEGITSVYNHTYNLSFADLAKLSQHNLKRLRKYHAEEFDDITIPNQNGRQVKNFSRFLLEELKKRNITEEDKVLIAEVKPPDTIQVEPQPANRTAAFPGGEEVWSSFLKRNLNPPAELKANEKKIVNVQFIVSEKGEIQELEIVQSAGPAFDKEVLRVLKRMPYWKPALENGQPVTATIKRSISFSRDNSSAGLIK